MIERQERLPASPLRRAKKSIAVTSPVASSTQLMFRTSLQPPRKKITASRCRRRTTQGVPENKQTCVHGQPKQPGAQRLNVLDEHDEAIGESSSRSRYCAFDVRTEISQFGVRFRTEEVKATQVIRRKEKYIPATATNSHFRLLLGTTLTIIADHGGFVLKH